METWVKLESWDEGEAMEDEAPSSSARVLLSKARLLVGVGSGLLKDGGDNVNSGWRFVGPSPNLRFWLGVRGRGLEALEAWVDAWDGEQEGEGKHVGMFGFITWLASSSALA